MRDAPEYERIRNYILDNPVRRGLAPDPAEYLFSSASMTLDEVPQRLKPVAWSA